MKRVLWWKILVVCFSATLGCAFVGYRQWQANERKARQGPNDEARFISGSKNPNQLIHSGEHSLDSKGQQPANERPVIMPSSKSIDAVIRPGDQASPSAAGKLPEVPRELMHSSKSGRIIPPPKPIGGGEAETPVPSPLPPTLMPSSKVGILIEPKQEEKAPAETEKKP